MFPEVREIAGPADGKPAAVNPPPLLWPVSRGNNVRYSVRLSPAGSSGPGRTLEVTNLSWAMFNPHRRLEAGQWHWQYGVQQPGKPVVWSAQFGFTVSDVARCFVTPTAETALAALPTGHPRILAWPEELAALRRKAASDKECQSLIAQARRIAKARLPEPSRAKSARQGSDVFQDRNFAKWASKGFAGNLVQDMTTLAPAYLLSGDETIGRSAVQRALFVAGLDPDGDTSPRVSDFADGSCMRTLALAYDTCFSLLTKEEQRQLREAMHSRAGRFFDRQINNLEGRVFNAHIWQHILMEAAEVALATLGELPEAKTWAGYVYELWVNRFPGMGGDDGGWAEGINYLGSNLETLLLMPQRFGRLAGVSFFDVPWYRNAPYFHIYAWPPRSASNGFGDGSENETTPQSRGSFVGSLGRIFGDPYALGYASAVAPNRQRTSPMLLLSSLRDSPPGNSPEPKPASQLPQSRVFRDVGLVAMHTDLSDARRDVFLALCSCPYGAEGHMHPCQNAFNLLVGGQRLFANSGYYIAYGDAHFRDWYHNTRGHNTVLIDGRGQPPGATAYGWIARHADSGSMAYCLGDASRAYGDTGLTRFRRHVALLRPSTVVIYDELEADHAAEWSWLLHSPAEIKSEDERARFDAAVAGGRGEVDLYGSSPLRVSIDSRFDPPADNWRGKEGEEGVRKYADQWHATAVTAEKTPRMRFLVVLQLHLAGDRVNFVPPVEESSGHVRVGSWQIEAALEPARATSLVIRDAENRRLLAFGVPSAECGGKAYTLATTETVLVEGPNLVPAPEQPPPMAP